MALLTLTNISVNFGGVRALSDLTLAVEPGSLHGLIGPNGAGKTTAMNVVSGLLRPSTGTMTFNGEAFTPRPHKLAAQGLARGFQAAAVIDGLNAVENILLGGYASTKAGILASALRLPGATREESALRKRAEAVLEEVGYVGANGAAMADLSTWQRRQIEIGRALLSNPQLLLLDEPAAGLTAGEVEALKALMRRLRDEGKGEKSILLIEHNVPLVFSLCDTVTAMAEGRDVTHGTPDFVRSHPGVISSYLGIGAVRRKSIVPAPAAKPAADRPIVLNLDDVSAGYGSTTVLHDIRFMIRTGETVALFGPNGAGKTTLLNTIIGERRARSGTVTWQGNRIDGLPIQSIVRLGIGIVPQGRAVIERQSVEDNLIISMTGLRLNAKQRRERLDEIFEQFPALGQRRRSYGASLSGGERQMLAIAKTLVRRPALLLLDEPSIGLAPTIVDEVQRIVADLSAKGLTVIIGEQSVDWVIPIAGRAYAIAAGRIVGEGPSDIMMQDAESLADRYLGGAQSKGATI
jgi:branched-chain amino acid transport system ATP-binding protein